MGAKNALQASGKFILWQIVTISRDGRILDLRKGENEMDKYLCEPCGYIYDPAIGDPEGGIAPGTAFEDIPDDWVCPICGVGKDMFVKVD